MNYSNHIVQSSILVALSIIVALASNTIRSKSIPLLSEEIGQATISDMDSNEPFLLTISLEQALDFYKKDVLFLDARDDVYFAQGHIKDAIKNIFFMELIFNIESIQSKTDPLVVYCGDPGCGDSEDLAYDLQDSGFTKLYVFKGGWLEWSAAGYPSESSN